MTEQNKNNTTSTHGVSLAVLAVSTSLFASPVAALDENKDPDLIMIAPEIRSATRNSISGSWYAEQINPANQNSGYEGYVYGGTLDALEAFSTKFFSQLKEIPEEFETVFKERFWDILA